MSKTYSRVGGVNPQHSSFDLTYTKQMTASAGQLLPCMCDELVPGDFFKINVSALIEFEPMIAPIMSELSVFFHFWFVPYRLLWKNWERFITGGRDGEFEALLPTFQIRGTGHATPFTDEKKLFGRNSLYDYLGFIPFTDTDFPAASITDGLPMCFPRDAYYFVFNEFYRDETLQPAVVPQQWIDGQVSWLDDRYDEYYAVETVNSASSDNKLKSFISDKGICYRNWEKDYFTSAALWQQRGTAPSIPLIGSAPIKIGDYEWTERLQSSVSGGQAGILRDTYTKVAGSFVGSQTIATIEQFNNNASQFKGSLNYSNSVQGQPKADISELPTFDIAQLREVFAIQRFMERNSRAGIRYTEFLQSHFAVHPTDERLDRPEYVGGCKFPVVVSQVLQSSETANSPQGTRSGIATVANSDYVGKYHAKEYGLIMGIMSVMPRPAYQQGVNRQWLRKTRYDFYFPEFANLSEQEVKLGELYWNNSDLSRNDRIFGYQARYNEMRSKDNMVVGDMRFPDYDFWHLARRFDSEPHLNSSFISTKGFDTADNFRRVFAVQDENPMRVTVAHRITGVRPMPLYSEPGLIDHV